MKPIFKNINRKDSNIFKLSKSNAKLGIINQVKLLKVSRL